MRSAISYSFLVAYGGDDEARTRDLCRDSKEETRNCKKPGVTDGSFSALRHPEEALLHPYRTHVLCPLDLCPKKADDMGSSTKYQPLPKALEALADISYNRTNGTLRYHLDPGSDSRRVWEEPRLKQEPTELSPASRASRFKVGSVRRASPRFLRDFKGERHGFQNQEIVEV